MLSTSFPRSPWFFLEVVTIIGINSNLYSNSKEPSKYPKVFMTDLSNWQSSNLLFHQVGFPKCSQKFLGISVTSLPVSIKVVDFLTFSIMSFFILFNFLLKRLHIGFVFFNSFNCFLFEFTYWLKMVLF